MILQAKKSPQSTEVDDRVRRLKDTEFTSGTNSAR